jgi:hypothetical protein
MSLGYAPLLVCGLLRFLHNVHHVAAPDFPNLILGVAASDQFDLIFPTALASIQSSNPPLPKKSDPMLT